MYLENKNDLPQIGHIFENPRFINFNRELVIDLFNIF